MLTKLCKLFKCLLKMACENCKKVKLNSCEECDFTVSTDCVEYKGDRMFFESSSVKNGSSRTLTEILEGLVNNLACTDRDSKLVQSDYTVLTEDICNILLLDTSLEVGDSPLTITLPTDDESFINKIIVLKDISDNANPSGETWIFDTAIKYDWQDDLSSTSFNTLAKSLHKTLYLTYITIDTVNYEWVVLSSNTDLKVLRWSGMTFSNNWEDSFSTLVVAKHDNVVRLEGAIVNGDSGATAFRLPVGFRPMQDSIFVCPMDGGDWFAHVTVEATGTIRPQSPISISPGDPITDNIYLHGISFFTQ